MQEFLDVGRLLEELPQLPSAVKKLSQSTQAAVHVAASRAGQPLEDWLDLRLRAAAAVELQDLWELSSQRREILRAWLDAEQRLEPLHIPPRRQLGYPFFQLLKSLVEEARLAAPPTPVRDRVGDARAHVLHAPIRKPKYLGDDERKIWHERMVEAGHEREVPLVSRAHVRNVETLLRDAPHMGDATRFVLGQLAAARRGAGLLALPPILLVGPPAAGKTWWAQRLADALCVGSEMIAMPGVTASFELSGGSASWNRAKPGRVVRLFLESHIATPVLVLDEVDKVSPGNYDPAAVLLHLVERESARRWRDEYYDAEFDVSRSIIIATANDANRIDPALRSRFREVVVEAPSVRNRVPIIASIWSSYRPRRSDLSLPKVLPQDVLESLAVRFTDARGVQRVFDEAIGRAALRPGRLRLTPEDFGAPPPCQASLRQRLR